MPFIHLSICPSFHYTKGLSDPLSIYLFVHLTLLYDGLAGPLSDSYLSIINLTLWSIGLAGPLSHSYLSIIDLSIILGIYLTICSSIKLPICPLCLGWSTYTSIWPSFHLYRKQIHMSLSVHQTSVKVYLSNCLYSMSIWVLLNLKMSQSQY